MGMGTIFPSSLLTASKFCRFPLCLKRRSYLFFFLRPKNLCPNSEHQLLLPQTIMDPPYCKGHQSARPFKGQSSNYSGPIIRFYIDLRGVISLGVSFRVHMGSLNQPPRPLYKQFVASMPSAVVRRLAFLTPSRRRLRLRPETTSKGFRVRVLRVIVETVASFCIQQGLLNYDFWRNKKPVYVFASLDFSASGCSR